MPLTEGEVTEIVRQIVAARERLGLVWRLIPGTVTGVESSASVLVDLDGDDGTVPARATVLAGTLVAGVRVMVLWAPPQGIYCWGLGAAAERVIGVEVQRVAGQSVATGGVPVSLSFDTVVRNVGGFGPGIGTDLILPLNGRYDCVANTTFASNATGLRFTGIYRNGNSLSNVQGPTVSGTSLQHGVTRQFSGAAGDVINVRVQHTAGISINVFGHVTLTYVGAD